MLHAVRTIGLALLNGLWIGLLLPWAVVVATYETLAYRRRAGIILCLLALAAAPGWAQTWREDRFSTATFGNPGDALGAGFAVSKGWLQTVWTSADGALDDDDLSDNDTDDLAEGENLYYTDERVDDRASELIQDGTLIEWVYDDEANTLTANFAGDVTEDDLTDDSIDTLSDVEITSASQGEILMRQGGVWADVAPTANPSATVDGTAANGSAETFMRSDAAPALADPFTPADGTQDIAGSLAVTTRVGVGLTTPTALVDVFATTPTANQVLVRVATSDDVSRFSVDEDGDVAADGSGVFGGNVTATGKLFWSGYAGASSGQPSGGEMDGTAIHIHRSAAGIDNGSGIGTIHFRGTESAGGATNEIGASIQAFGDTTWSADDSPGRLVFSTTPDGSDTAVERMRITNTGLVRIDDGTLGSNGTATGAGDLYVEDFLEVDGGGEIRSQSASSAQLNVLTVGLVAVGAASQRSVGITLEAPRSGWQTGVGRIVVGNETSNNAHDSFMAFYTKNNAGTVGEKVRITSTGAMGIGTDSTVSAKLHAIATTEQLRLGYDANNYASFAVGSTGTLTITPTGGAPVRFPNAYSLDVAAGSNRAAYLLDDGTLGYNSSARIVDGQVNKLNERAATTDDTDRLMLLQPKVYDRASGRQREIGLIAEDVAEVWPEIVSYRVERYEDTVWRDDGTSETVLRIVTTDEPETVNYHALIVPLLQRVQAQEARIDALEARVEALETANEPGGGAREAAVIGIGVAAALGAGAGFLRRREGAA